MNALPPPFKLKLIVDFENSRGNKWSLCSHSSLHSLQREQLAIRDLPPGLSALQDRPAHRPPDLNVRPAHLSSQGPPNHHLGSLPRAPTEPQNSSSEHTLCLGTCSAPGPGESPEQAQGRRIPPRLPLAPKCRGPDSRRRGCTARGGPSRAAPPAAEPPPRPGSPPPSRTPASPRGHHHIVDDQVCRGQRPGALFLPRAAGFAGPGTAPAAPIPFRRCSRRRCRHVKCREPTLLAQAPQPELGTVRGWGEGRGRGGAEAAGRSQGQRPRRPPSWRRAKTLPAPSAPPRASVATAILERSNHRRFCPPENNLRRHLD